MKKKDEQAGNGRLQLGLNRRLHLKAISVIIVLSLSLYANTLKNGFVYDDKITIVENAFIKEIHNLPKLFKKEYLAASNELTYRPVATLSYFLDYSLWGLNPLGYHLTNILLHSINGMALYIFLTLLLRQPVSAGWDNPCLLISILFAVHPVLTEAVGAVSYREDLLAFLFYMSTLSLYLILRKPATDQRPLTTAFLYLLSCLFYILAILSKEMAATLPLIVLCYEWVWRKKGSGLRPLSPNRFNLGYIAITLSYAFLRFFYFYNPREGSLHVPLLTERLLTIPWLLLSYIKLILFPVRLSADYPLGPVMSLLSASFAVPVFILGLSFITLLLCVARREVRFGFYFFILTLIPVSSIIPIANPLAERYLYLPIAGFAIASGIAVSSIEKRSVLPVLFVLVSIYSLSVIKRNTVWKDDYTLWSDTVKKMPHSYRAHYGLGAALDKKGRLDEAIKEYLLATGYKPDSAEAHYDLGNAYSSKGLLDEAVEEYIIALKLKPGYVEAHNNLGLVHYRQGQLDEAVREYETVLGLKPRHTKTYNNLGLVYAKQGRLDEAVEQYRKALMIEPYFAEAHYNLGLVYLSKNMKEPAKTEFETTLKIKPDHLQSRQQLSLLNNLQ